MIFYFSATGNSKYAAEQLQKEFGGEMISIPEAACRKEFSYEIGKGEKVIFVFPVYFWNLPFIVSEFLEKMTLRGEDLQVCAVITCGGQLLGADMQFYKALKQKGLRAKAVYELKMPDNCVNYFNLPNPEAQVMILRSAEKDLEAIIDSIKFSFRVSYQSGIFGKLWTKICLPVYKNQCRTKKYRVQNHCIGCGLCQSVCPSQAITMQEGRPNWIKDKCVWCQGCINRCPVEAIQFGKKTEKRGRYIHPILK